MTTNMPVSCWNANKLIRMISGLWTSGSLRLRQKDSFTSASRCCRDFCRIWNSSSTWGWVISSVGKKIKQFQKTFTTEQWRKTKSKNSILGHLGVDHWYQKSNSAYHRILSDFRFFLDFYGKPVVFNGLFYRKLDRYRQSKILAKSET